MYYKIKMMNFYRKKYSKIKKIIFYKKKIKLVNSKKKPIILHNIKIYQKNLMNYKKQIICK